MVDDRVGVKGKGYRGDCEGVWVFHRRSCSPLSPLGAPDTAHHIYYLELDPNIHEQAGGPCP